FVEAHLPPLLEAALKPRAFDLGPVGWHRWFFPYLLFFSDFPLFFAVVAVVVLRGFFSCSASASLSFSFTFALSAFGLSAFVSTIFASLSIIRTHLSWRICSASCGSNPRFCRSSRTRSKRWL